MLCLHWEPEWLAGDSDTASSDDADAKQLKGWFDTLLNKEASSGRTHYEIHCWISRPSHRTRRRRVALPAAVPAGLVCAEKTATLHLPVWHGDYHLVLKHESKKMFCRREAAVENLGVIRMTNSD